MNEGSKGNAVPSIREIIFFENKDVSCIENT
jgi:hypothetical protein